VRDARPVRGRKRFGDLRRDLKLSAQCLGPGLSQRRSIHQLRHEIGRAVLAPDIEECDDAGMMQRADRTRFGFEACASIRIAREGFGQDLDRDLASKPRVLAAIHLAHTPGADRRQDFVGAKPCAWFE
jgi:hypothetical protein